MEKTAEMPGLYDKGHFDLAGFIVGCVDENKLLGPHRVENNDILYALESSGFHSNGYSLVRKWVSENKPTQEVIDKLLAPTKLYFEIPKLVETLGVDKIHSAANITGGGITGNLPRVMPKGSNCEINFDEIPTQSGLKISLNQMVRRMDVETTFNLGCGMIVSISNTAQEDFEKSAGHLTLVSRKSGKSHLRTQLKSKSYVCINVTFF